MVKVTVKSKVMQKNDKIAARMRGKYSDDDIFCVNMIGSPGSGKTTLLEAVFSNLEDKKSCAVIEGDVKTDNDMRRITATGVQSVQIETDGSCHLNAEQVETMLARINSDGIKTLIIENVGNLICPVSYDLGEHNRLIVISVAEGVDKPLKYPSAFMSSKTIVITKIDLAPYVDVSVDKLRDNALSINPKLRVFTTSAKTGEGIEEFKKFLIRRE